MPTLPMNEIIPIPEIQQRIHAVRGKRVIFDADLARFYGVGTRELNKAVSRNPSRFPDDFCFQLTLIETRNLMFRFGTSSPQDVGDKMSMC